MNAIHNLDAERHHTSRFIIWLPLILLQIYLVFTLFVLTNGPIEWPIHNADKLISLLVYYQVMFIIGYSLLVNLAPTKNKIWSGFDFQTILLRYFWPLLLLAALALLIGHRNIAMTSSYIPTTIFTDFYHGLVNPLDVYLYKLSDQAKANFSGRPIATALFGVFIVCKALLITLLISEWPKLNLSKRILGVAVTLIPLMSAVSVGTNKPIFDLLFYYLSIFLVSFLLIPRGKRASYVMKRKAIVAIILSLAVFSPFYFQYTMSQRAWTNPNKYVSSQSQINMRKYFKRMCENEERNVKSGCLFISVTSNYLTQGYYGMSLAIEKPFDSTYGIGHSTFLLEAFKKYLGLDLKARTYERKASREWSENQWFSMYTQWANDFSFWGVGIVMLGLGFLSAAVWVSAVDYNNFAARCMVPLFVIMFLFIPANNQIFNMLETLATFMILMTCWVAGFVGSFAGKLRITQPT